MGNQKNRPGAATPGQATGNSQTSKVPYQHFNPVQGRSQVTISDFLSPGQKNAVTLQYLTQVMGKSGRKIRREIEQERRTGCLILSDNQHGYYLANDKTEAEMFVRSMRHRAIEILRTARAIEGAAGID